MPSIVRLRPSQLPGLTPEMIAARRELEDYLDALDVYEARRPDTPASHIATRSELQVFLDENPPAPRVIAVPPAAVTTAVVTQAQSAAASVAAAATGRTGLSKTEFFMGAAILALLLLKRG